MKVKEEGDIGLLTKFLLEKNQNDAIFSKSAWIADSGASSHMTNNKLLLFDTVEVDAGVSVGNGEMEGVQLIGKRRDRIWNRDGKIHTIMLKKVCFVPSLICNLFSLTSSITKGFVLGNTKKVITLTRNKTRLECCIMYNTQNGFLCGLDLASIKNKCESRNLSLYGDLSQAQKLHAKLGHPGMDAVKRTAVDLGINLDDDFKVCEDCTLAKSRRKKLNQYASNKATKAGERLFTNTSWINTPSIRGSRFWVLTVDEHTNMMWSHFVRNKSDLKEVVTGLIKELKNERISVSYIRCDNSGENSSMENECINLNLKITFEYTPRDTPQHNGIVERA